MKNSISLSLPSFEQYFPRGSFTSSAFGITGLDLSSPLASSEFDSKLVVVVRLWRISRGMNHLFQEIINIINITTLYPSTLNLYFDQHTFDPFRRVYIEISSWLSKSFGSRNEKMRTKSVLNGDDESEWN